MNYTYLPSQYCNPNTSALDIYSDLTNGQLKFICYHITTNSYYPFLQIMLELKQDNHSFICPSITINNDSTCADISFLILKKIKTDLKNLRCNTDTLTKKDAYKGIFVQEESIYALIDISSVDISCLNLSQSSPIWFALPTEIANINSICDMPISEDVIKLFTYLLPELGVLYKKNSRDIYLLPDIVYTKSALKQSEFRTIFGPSKDKIYFHFCKSFLDALENTVDKVDKVDTTDTVEAVNRYALFIDDPITVGISNLKKDVKHVENLEDIMYEKYKSRNCIILQNWHILVKKYELFTPMTYHVLNMETLNSIK
jgi:hypothetical protein